MYSAGSIFVADPGCVVDGCSVAPDALLDGSGCSVAPDALLDAADAVAALDVSQRACGACATSEGAGAGVV